MRQWQAQLAVVGGLIVAEPALAQVATTTPDDVFHAFERLLPEGQEIFVLLTAMIGIIVFAVVVAVHWSRAQSKLTLLERDSAEKIDDLRAERDAARSLLMASYPIVIRWSAEADDYTIDHAVPPGSALPATVDATLAFDQWLMSSCAVEIEHAIDGLLRDGAGFSLLLATRKGGVVQADGLAVGAMVIVRMRDAANSEKAYADLRAGYDALKRDAQALQTVLESVSLPAWLRDEQGRLSWVNDAYAKASGAADAAVAVETEATVFDAATNAQIMTTLRQEGQAIGRFMGGRDQRRQYAVAVRGSGNVSAGIAMDVTEDTAMMHRLDRAIASHLHTLNRLSTGVASFDAAMRLEFANAAARRFWQLDTEWLDRNPDAGDIIDSLRAARRLPDEADYREWKQRFLDIPAKAREDLWRLPDGQKLRVTASPRPEGGMVLLFDDVTERLSLQSRFEQLSGLQTETLEHLSEAIAVFGSNGRLRLSNSALADMWQLDEAAVASLPRIEQLIGWLSETHHDEEVWAALRGAVTGVQDRRQGLERRFTRADGLALQMSVMPLPDGGTLVVFIDVTASAKVEQALRQANDALTAAAKLRNDFVQKVSYELRVPLTTILGYAEILAASDEGDLGFRQRAYADNIMVSGKSLLAIVDDILDLATVDAGTMDLKIAPVDIPATIERACEGLRDRIEAANLHLDIQIDRDCGELHADASRLRQVLFNIIANAVGFSPTGATIHVKCAPDGDAVTFSVRDHGPGIPETLRGKVFDRFESHSAGTGHRGAGLGLAIVRSFVALHGGKIHIGTAADGDGTLVVCRFPRQPQPPTVAEFTPAPPTPSVGGVGHGLPNPGPSSFDGESDDHGDVGAEEAPQR